MAIDSPETNVSGELASLSQAYLGAATLIADACDAGAGEGSFVLREGPAIPEPPDGALASPLLQVRSGALARAR